MNPDRLMTQSLRTSPHGERVIGILAAALASVDPGKAVNKFVSREGAQLIVSERGQSRLGRKKERHRSKPAGRAFPVHGFADMELGEQAFQSDRIRQSQHSHDPSHDGNPWWIFFIRNRNHEIHP